MPIVEDTRNLLLRPKQIAERLGQPFTWAHIVQASLAAAHKTSGYGREPILQEVIAEIDQRILRHLGKTPGEVGLDIASLSSIAIGLAAYCETRPAPVSAGIHDLLLRWVASGSAEPNDWTLDQIAPIFRRFGLQEGCFVGTMAWPSQRAAANIPFETGNAEERTWVDQLDQLVGLQSIKADVGRLRSFLTVLKERKKRNLPAGKLPLHQVFFGNPGTGKTTIARVLASVYKEFGFLECGQLVETDRSGLVGSVIGETEAKTTEKIHQALGGVLFVDEAYSLATDSQQDFGQRAIDTLVKAMEDHRDRLIVIVAGYEQEMGRFLEANPGLYGRFNRHLHFPDYTGDELIEVFRRFAQKEKFSIHPDAFARVETTLSERKARLGRRFGNARDVRTLWETCLQLQADRLCASDPASTKLDELSEEVLLHISAPDVPERF